MNKFINTLKSHLGAAKLNSSGSSLNGKYLIIESDDWGTIRTPSKDALKQFEKAGLDLSRSVYKNDALESMSDLEDLFNVLLKFKDIKGNHPCFTANTIVANPDFERIEESGFKNYFFEPYTRTIERYPEHKEVHNLHLKGKELGVFIPQFHGREHLNYKRWFKVLQEGNERALLCFKQGATYSGEGDYSFMEAYDWDAKTDIEEHKQVIADGLKMFDQLFGFKSKSFIAPCYNWDSEVESTLASNGVEVIQGLRSQLAPTGKFDVYNRIPHSFGEVNENGLFFNIRNAFLEPSLIPNKDWVDSCLAQIRMAFLFNKPAVISSHRINYIGYIDPKNKFNGLKILESILSKVLRKWPDVQFISTDKIKEVQ